MGWRLIQVRLSTQTIQSIFDDLKLGWIYDPDYTTEWDNNLTRLIGVVDHWCKNSGIRDYALGFTQIELCGTFVNNKDAMLFKLRWHNAQRA